MFLITVKVITIRLFSGAAKETEQLTPERALESVKESQRMKIAELESERSRTDDSERRKEEERFVSIGFILMTINIFMFCKRKRACYSGWVSDGGPDVDVE